MTALTEPVLNTPSEKLYEEHRSHYDLTTASRPTPAMRSFQSHVERKELDDLNQVFPWILEEREELDELSVLKQLFPWLMFEPGQTESIQNTYYSNLNQTDIRLVSLSPVETHHFAEVMASMGGH